MSESTSSGPAPGEKKGLPRRDWILLPAIGLLTVCTLLGVTELTARQIFYPSKSDMHSCLVLDPATGLRGVPNTTCWDKTFETPLIEYKFNSCGDRAGMECALKPKGVYRIVMSGASVAFGLRVEREKTFAALLGAQLSQATGGRVELYNQSVFAHATDWGDRRVVAHRLGKIMSAQPDLILVVISQQDIRTADTLLPRGQEGNSLSLRGWARIKAELGADSLKQLPADMLNESRALYMLRHYLYESQSQYVKAWLMQGDTNGYLRAQLSQFWLKNLGLFDLYAGQVEERAQAGNAQFVVVLVPDRAQATMASMGEWPAGYNPYELGDQLRAITIRHGGFFIDLVPDFRNVPHPEQHFYPIDGHPDPEGSLMISRFLFKELTSGAIPALSAAGQTQPPFEKGK